MVKGIMLDWVRIQGQWFHLLSTKAKTVVVMIGGRSFTLPKMLIDGFKVAE